MRKSHPIRRKKRNRLIDIIAAIILIALIVVIFFSFKDYFQYKLLRFATATQENVDADFDAEMVVMRKEYIIEAPATGNFIVEAEEGERIKEGSSIGYIEKQSEDSLTPKRIAVNAQIGGIVSYDLDGWEQILNPEQAENIDWETALSQLRDGVDKEAAEDTNLAAGRNIAKIIDNLVNYLVLLKTDGKETAFAIDEYITFTLPDGYSLQGCVIIFDSRQDGNYYYLSVSSAESSMLDVRYNEVTVLADRVSGIGIPSSAVVTDDSGAKGVFCIQKRQLAFKEVTVIADNGDTAIVDGLSETEVVVTNPKRAYAGQRTY